MTSWSTFVTEAPELAATAARLWPGIWALDRGESLPADGHVFTVAYLATVRPDGGPRLHPFCPVIAGGRLYAAIPGRSPKGRDLRRDPRCIVHAMPGPEDDELCIRALATEVHEAATRAAVVTVVDRSGVGGMVHTASNDPLFELDLQRVDVARWLDIGRPGTRAVRHRWPPP